MKTGVDETNGTARYEVQLGNQTGSSQNRCKVF